MRFFKWHDMKVTNSSGTEVGSSSTTTLTLSGLADGTYYFTASVPAYDRIVLRRSDTLAGLADAEETTVWKKHETGHMGDHICICQYKRRRDHTWCIREEP